MNSLLQSINQQTMDIMNTAMAKTGTFAKAGITVASPGLVGYELQAPSKHLYPVLSPLRNRIARTMAPQGSLACTWRALTGINTARLKASVGFGVRNGAISYSEVNRSATYKTFGLEDLIDFEAVWLARGFEDVRALSAMTVLQAVMIEEERLILGGNVTALGAPSVPTSVRTATLAGTWTTTDTAYVKVMALPTYGYGNATLSDLTQLLADHSVASLSKSQAITATTDGLGFATTAQNGAVAYAWFVAENTAVPTDAFFYLAAITTAPAVLLNAAPVVTNTTLAAQGADTSGDATAYDGILSQITPVGNTTALGTVLDSTNASGTLYQLTGGANPPSSLVYNMLSSLPITNVPGGTALTSDGAGGIVEFDVVLKALWDYQRIGPSLCIMHSTDARSVTKIIGGNSTGTQVKMPIAPGSKDLIGGLFFTGYLNKFTSAMTPGSPDVIPFLIHPYAVPGTIIFHSEQIPYPNPNVGNVLEIELQSEYADYDFAMTTRQFPHGVYAMGVLKDYFPGGAAIIRNIRAS